MADEESKSPTDAGRFAQMADRIEHNANLAAFGGAFMIVPPAGGGDPMEALILDWSGDPVQFFMLLQAKIQTRLKDLDDTQRQAAFGRR